jgi:iron complex transport system substrate-binding protein
MGGHHCRDDVVRLDNVRLAASSLLIVVLQTLLACNPSEAPRAVERASHSRIVTLAPNLAELVFAAGAGEYLVGVSAYSDYPPDVTGLPIVGDAFTIDQEVLALLKPDLLLAWQSGTPAHVVDELRRAGYVVETVRTQNLIDISAALRQIGELTGRQDYATGAADEFDSGLRRLEERYASSEHIRVFYQVSKRPLYTVSNGHFVSELISLCGGQNVFADLEELAPGVDVEAVIDRDPEVMLAAADAGNDAFGEWDRWPNMTSNRYGNRFLLPGDEISRPTPRVLAAGAAICDALQVARERRANAGSANDA